MTIFLKLLATCLGIGYLLPIGQGTLAAFIGLFLVQFFLELSLSWQLGIVVSGCIIGILVSSCAEKEFGRKDDHRIVIDEFVSIFITFFGFSLGISWYWLVVGFLLNRFFDIVKPPPIFALQRLPGGWGIIMDDIIAGIYSNVVLRAMMFFLYV
ncbi:MAG: phosphatidylglycerophosphatase A [Candidatus Sungbacteria bacterium]|nr:phosphatidylglycerophosphatase A [Candidatus Sungbacteria bacterium]